MKTIVQKFGGTSVSSKESRKKVVNRIIEKYELGYKIIVIVSAMGRKGDPYATDSLLNLIDTRLVSDRERDLLISCGEIISSVVLANDLHKNGHDAISLSSRQAGILTDNNYGDAQIIDINPEIIKRYLNENKIVIIPGFQGYNEYGEITTLGRGGSDISAVAIGKALNSDHVEIFTDVDGIMTADPTIVPNAKVLKRMGYSEVYQLAEDGAKIIHPRAVRLAQQFNIPLVIKNTYSNNEGTSIEGTCQSFIGDQNQFANEKIITAITYKKGRIQVSLPLSEDEDRNKIQKLMDEITSHNISLDLITFLVEKKIFTIGKEDKNKLISILEKESLSYEIVDNCCKISAIGYKMQGVPGVMAKIMKALSKKCIKVLQTSDSHNTIWCLIKETDMKQALSALHEEFQLNI